MKKIILFLLFSLIVPAQKVETIQFKQNIKDRRGLAKSLTLIDNRTDKEIGKISGKKGDIEFKLHDGDLKSFIENRFAEDNKVKGNNDIVIMLEELKIYDEQARNDKFMYSKAKIKISSFLKRNDKYYFISRYDNVIVSNPERTANSTSKYLSDTVSDIITGFIKVSYSNGVSNHYITENDITSYNSYLIKNNKSLHQELKDGVYLNFKSFSDQKPAEGYSVEKNKKGRVVRIKDQDDLVISLGEVFGYVDAGIAYRLTPNGFQEMKKNENGFYIIISRSQLFAKSTIGPAGLIGAFAGGIVGAAIGAAIDSGSNKGAAEGFGFKSPTMTTVYVDSLTGDFNFQQ
ncbi:glycine zipper family protein [Chryseobacterium pennipullorum]|uniref:Glycine zipper domain-containing protein n=1 Tax=Chryseobacterium pennipullorum TaxID=2258963 RepID=A0A3D9ATU8_9FLAO|nr:hypothetical protein [Chryseobacterium pennipullorum]REC44769.1 hypothetical protein DRF67_17000 [Chryseobacterium pennipullorum]